MTQGPWFYCLKHNTVEDRDGFQNVVLPIDTTAADYTP